MFENLENEWGRHLGQKKRDLFNILCTLILQKRSEGRDQEQGRSQN